MITISSFSVPEYAPLQTGRLSVQKCRKITNQTKKHASETYRCVRVGKHKILSTSAYWHLGRTLEISCSGLVTRLCRVTPVDYILHTTIPFRNAPPPLPPPGPFICSGNKCASAEKGGHGKDIVEIFLKMFFVL